MPDNLEGTLNQAPGLTYYLSLRKALSDQAQREQAQQQQQQFIQERTNLGQNPAAQDLVGLGMRYASPQDLLHYGQASEDRKAALAQKADATEKMFDYHIKSIQSTVDNTLLRIKDAEAARMLKDKWEVEKNDLLRQKNDILLELGRAKSETNKPPSGYRPTAEGNLEAIPGGPADLKIQGQYNQDTANLNESLSNMDRLASEANAIKEHPGLGGITGLRGVVPNIPGGQAANAQARLDTLKSQVAFGVLQNMRNNSKTGGALGQVSNVEEKMLMDNLAGLGRAQSKEEYQAALQRIIDYTNGAKDRLRSAYNVKHSAKSSGAPDGVDAKVWGVMTPQERALWQK